MDKTILVVEDLAELRDIYKQTLENAGYKVLLASHDTDAFDLFFKHKPKVVIMDLNLGPNSLPGNEVCKQMIAIAPGAKVICASGNFEMFEPDYGFKNGFCAVVSKPVTSAELLRVVGESFDEFEKTTK